jgi:hypothetical protein
MIADELPELPEPPTAAEILAAALARPDGAPSAAEWTPYLDLQGTSPIEAYRIGRDELEVRFRRTRRRPAKTYRYSLGSCGADLNSLIDLALSGSGLATYIARERPEYADRR